jgi:RNA polymerase sigma factor (sigma-70 family)
MSANLQGRGSLPDRSAASEGPRIPGLQGSGDDHRFETERTRNVSQAIWGGLLARAAGALGADVQDEIPSARGLPPQQVWHCGSMRRDSARHASLVELCLARGCPLEDAKELVQEAHLHLFAYQRFAPVSNAESLLRRIVINLSINHYHREPSRRFTFESVEKLDRRGILIDPAPGPERTLAAEQQLDRVVNVISAMNRRTCQIFIVQRGGYSYEEVAAAFAIKPRTVEKYVALATTALTEMMPALSSGVRLPTMSKGS